MKKLPLVFSVFLYLLAGALCVGIVGSISRELETYSIMRAFARQPLDIRVMAFEGAALALLLATLLLMRSGRDIPFPSKRARKIIIAAFIVLIPAWTVLVFSDYIFLSKNERIHRLASERIDEYKGIQYRQSDFLPLARQFDELGDYADSKEKSRYCWYQYGTWEFNNCERFSMRSNRERERVIERLREAREAFVSAGDHADAEERIAVVDQRIAELSAMNEMRVQMDVDIKNSDLDAVLAALERFKGDYDYRKLNDEAQRLRTARKKAEEKERYRVEHEEPNRRLAAYLETVPGATYAVAMERTPDQNITLLASEDPVFKDSPERVAEVMVAMRRFESLAKYLAWRNEAKKGRDPELSLSDNNVLATVILMQEKEGQSEECKQVIEQFTQFAWRGGEDYARYAALLLLHEGGPEWIERCYPDDPKLETYKKPGTMEHRVVNAPPEIKNAFLRQRIRIFDKERFKRTYTGAEAAALFNKFKPARPFSRGIIYIVDHENLPPNANFWMPKIHDCEVNAENLSGTMVAYGDQAADGSFDEKSWAKTDTLICVSNPNNARFAYQEKYRYTLYGKYKTGRGDLVDVYTPTVRIRIIDLLTGKTVSDEEKTAEMHENYSFRSGGFSDGDVYSQLNFFERWQYISEKVKEYVAGR